MDNRNPATRTPNPPPLPHTPAPGLAATLALVDSWQLTLEAERKSPGTRQQYLGSMTMFLRWCHHRGLTCAPEDFTASTCREWLAESARTRADTTVLVRWSGIRSFFNWCAQEEEITPNPMGNVKSPQIDTKVVDLVPDEDLVLLLKSIAGPEFVDRRDEAMILMYADTGARLAEIVGIQVGDIDLRERVAKVVGKGRKERWVPFGARTAKAVDRYMRMRARHRGGGGSALWLSVTGRPMTPDGTKQMIARRSKAAGLRLHAHQFRHTFADKWLDQEGSETALMDLAGWSNRQMVGRYGAARRAERARQEYQSRSPMDRL